MNTDMNTDMNTNDVEKRWHDPAAMRAAAIYVAAILLTAAIAFTVAMVWHSRIAGILVPAALFIGGIGAFIQTYRVWRAGGVWPIWQGAGWVLLMLMLFCLGVPASVW